MNTASIPTLSDERFSRPVRSRITWRIAPLVSAFLSGVLFLGLSLVAEAGGREVKPDFSSYDVPLYLQITHDIKARVAARLGEGKSMRDRYFIIPFAYENKGNAPEFSHSFMAVIRVLADRGKPRLTPGLKIRTYKNREFEAFTISWLPHDFATNPHLCVFHGWGSRLFPRLNRCPGSVGRDFNLEETIKLAVHLKNAVCMWGPYEISKGAFDLVVKRRDLLNGGTIKYRADDRLYRKDRIAINCFHALQGLDKLYPNGGIFNTGFKMWGINGTARVLAEYKDRAAKEGLLLEPVPVDERNDRFGFVYAPARCSQDIYNPFKKAAAYRR